MKKIIQNVLVMIFWFIVLTLVMVMILTCTYRTDSWQMIECWNETFIKEECVGYKYNIGSIKDCFETTQICKEGRNCNVICVGQYPIGCKEIYDCQECRNSLTKERMEC